ncbi:hypothetical protein LEM8419_00745 [Neolewinella maritima]|uniref:YqaE/Pmp3 family membrane protein n=1 Tax=Neolewinella maritima TaxID=1383882 RepID=A0ABN8F3U9_9BACT|nr:YqaE/Pmp3 family membrane protein [Neolewinella maritima]CAH0999445.1 hypothetical protein LEM8419_00745 [Neolewinella maritima]
MLKTLTTSVFICLLVVLCTSVAVAPPVATAPVALTPAAALAEAGLPAGTVDKIEDLLTMTPKEYRKLTGKKLSLKEVIVLKAAQKKIKKQMRSGERQRDDIPVSKGLFIVLAIFVPIAAVIMMGIADEWSGNRWWIALILYALCYIPGLIYTLTKLNDFSYNE